MDKHERMAGDLLDIPAVGGHRDEYWEVDIGGDVVRIQKPRDALVDLRAMTALHDEKEESVEDRSASLRHIASERLRERSKRREG